MIELNGVSKIFYDNFAIDDLTLHIPNATIFGLIGPNGSGKSTILRLISGIYSADSGYLKVDGQSVYENLVLKQRIALVSYDPFFLPQSTLTEMRRFYRVFYPDFSDRFYRQLLDIFHLDETMRIQRFTSSQRRIAALVLALALNPNYLLLDESFNNLDFSLRQPLKNILRDNLENFGQTTIITANNLLELENICDSLAMINKGKIILSGSHAELTTDIHKLQLAFPTKISVKDLSNLNILNYLQEAHHITILVKGNLKTILKTIKSFKPFYIDQLEINLEELFIYDKQNS